MTKSFFFDYPVFIHLQYEAACYLQILTFWFTMKKMKMIMKIKRSKPKGPRGVVRTVPTKWGANYGAFCKPNLNMEPFAKTANGWNYSLFSQKTPS